MTVAGVKPSISVRSDIMPGDEHGYYSRSKVREILIRALVDMDIEDVDALSTLKTLPDERLVVEQSERLIDRFMESRNN